MSNGIALVMAALADIGIGSVFSFGSVAVPRRTSDGTLYSVALPIWEFRYSPERVAEKIRDAEAKAAALWAPTYWD